jgi:hypothetical protein
MRVNLGLDIESAALLAFTVGYRGTTATAPTATTFTTDGVNIPVNSVAGQYVVVNATVPVVGIIQSNTSATNSVLTIDRWYDLNSLPANVNVAAATTPAAGAWQIVPGKVPASYMGLTATATAPSATDTTLTGELNAAGAAGLNRQLATYAHTASASTTTLTKTFTTAAADTIPVTLAQMAIFQGVVVASSRMVFRTLLSATATMSAIGGADGELHGFQRSGRRRLPARMVAQLR